QGVYVGLLTGFALWSYTLLFPTILRSLPEAYHRFSQSLLTNGPFGWNWLRPEALIGFESFDPLTHGVVWALGLNTILYIWVSRNFRSCIDEQIQAESFFYYETKPMPSQSPYTEVSYLHQDVARLKVGGLINLAKRITGEGPTTRAFQQFCTQDSVEL